MLADLSGRVAMVTGGSRGLGFAIARVLVEQGASVALADIDGKAAKDAAQMLVDEGARASGVAMDVRSPDSVATAVRYAKATLGAVEILINNAAVAHGPRREEGAGGLEDEWSLILDVNLRGVVNCCDEVLPEMAERRYGKIVNISSTAGRAGDPVRPYEEPEPQAKPERTFGTSAYSLSKAAVIRYSQTLAAQVARFNINVNCVCPSRMVTPMGLEITSRAEGIERNAHVELLKARQRWVRSNNRFGRELEPDDVAKMVAFLSSDDTKNVTGQTINVDGGFKIL